MRRVKIVNCRNPFLWYREESRKPLKKRCNFAFDEAPDGKGVIIPGKGYVFEGDFKYVNKQ